MFFIANSDDPPSSETPVPEPPSLLEPTSLTTSDDPHPTFDPTPLQPHVSLHAMGSVPATNTFRLYGIINNTRITILVDSGSTQNFVQPRVAKFLNLCMHDTTPLRVMVGKGSVLDCRQLCPDTSVIIQNHIFVVTLCVLPLSGADAVLGVEWLRTLGPIVMDYSMFTMQFTDSGQHVTLHADVQIDENPASAHQIRRMLTTNVTSGLFHLSLLPITKPEPALDPPHPIPAINVLLHKYHSLFQQPSTLPPSRQHDHYINLLPFSKPVNVRPYRYPHFQKRKLRNR